MQDIAKAEFWQQDPWLKPYGGAMRARLRYCQQREASLGSSLSSFSLGHLHYGILYQQHDWQLREWAPNASEIYLVGDMNDWQILPTFRYQSDKNGDFSLQLPHVAIKPGQHCRLLVRFPGGEGWRLPAYSQYVVQDKNSKIFTVQIRNPQQQYRFTEQRPEIQEKPIIYEAHVGMAQEHDHIGSYQQFRQYTLPYIAELGYNTVQLMAIQEHPYYGSFGYHVSNLFAVSSRFGTPEELKELIDAAHGYGLRVIIDLIHSHAVRNEEEGLANFDGTRYQYFHEGERGVHKMWDSYTYNYGKDEVLHILLSNLHFFLDEYQVDGFRFDGVTSMLYLHHGLGKAFTGYGDYFEQIDEEAIQYLYLANKLIHTIYPQAITIAEDVSGMPGLANPEGIGFDYRLAMGVSDCWFKLLDCADETWDIDYLWHELTNARYDEQTISYVECHDQALVGGKTFLFTLADSDIYFHMHKLNRNLTVDRALALHKLARLATIATAKDGYLTFMGNEFGHPEWVDFPREGNNWSYQHARRLWSLCYQQDLCFSYLHAFEKAMIHLLRHQRLLEYHWAYEQRHNDNKTFSFSRGKLLFAFNFHPQNSYQHYLVKAEAGSYQIVLSSDNSAFGGFDRIDESQVHFTQQQQQCDMLQLYLPARCALVLEKT